MKLKFSIQKLYVIIIFLICSSLYSQVKIGNNPTSINNNSLLELESTNKGIRLPRLELIATNNPAPLQAFVEGMTVYNTASSGNDAFAVSPGIYYSNGSQWIAINPVSIADTALGSIAIFPFSSVPSDYLPCNGQAVSRTFYAALFARIGTTYGSGDGTTTFNLPDLRGEFVRGWDNGRGIDPGRLLGSAQGSATARPNTAFTGVTSVNGEHTHSIITNDNGGVQDNTIAQSASQTPNSARTTSAAGNHSHSVTIDGGGDSETRPRNRAMIYAIKAVESVIVPSSTSAAVSAAAVANEPWFKTSTNSGATSNNDNVYINGSVGIGNMGANASAALEITSISQGFLLPRLTSAQRLAIPSPANGLQVYDTNTNSIWYYNGTSNSWINANPATTNTLTANNNLVSTVNGVATTLTPTSGTISNSLGFSSTGELVTQAPTAANTPNIYTANGTLTGNRVVDMQNRTLAFAGGGTQVVNQFSVDGTTFSVDALNNRVGIGTTTPSSGLTIVNDNTADGNADNVQIRNFGNVGFPLVALGSSRGTQASPTNLVNGHQLGGFFMGGRWNNSLNELTGSYITSTYRGNGTTGLTDLQFGTSNTTRLTITENGNVGIGVTAPSKRLDIFSGTPDDSGLRLRNINSNTPPIASAPLGVDSNGNVVVGPGQIFAKSRINLSNIGSGSVSWVGGFSNQYNISGVTISSQSGNQTTCTFTFSTPAPNSDYIVMVTTMRNDEPSVVSAQVRTTGMGTFSVVVSDNGGSQGADLHVIVYR